MNNRAEPEEGRNPEFAGDFTVTERDFLSRQFGRCRLALIARSNRDASLTVLTWEVTGAGRDRRGPSPLVGIPNRAVYVLHAADPPSLVPVRSAAELEREFGEAVPQAPFGTTSPLWESAKRALGGLFPWHSFRP
jgi:hypothetical protein